jgi:spore coat protein U-like protein
MTSRPPKRRPLILIASLAIAGILLSPVAAAQTRGIRTCNVSASGINFGTFTGSQLAGSGAITLNCNGNGNNNLVAIALSQGFSNSFINRSMTNLSDHLFYNMYTDPAFSIIWGNGQGQTQQKFALFDFRQIGSVTQGFTIFARIERQNLPPPGRYVDQVTITVFF